MRAVNTAWSSTLSLSSNTSGMHQYLLALLTFEMHARNYCWQKFAGLGIQGWFLTNLSTVWFCPNGSEELSRGCRSRLGVSCYSHYERILINTIAVESIHR